MDVVSQVLEASYLRVADEERTAWAALREKRDELVAALRARGISESGARKWIAQIEARQRIDPNDPRISPILERMGAAAGAATVGAWLQEARRFADASDRAFRSASELADRGGLKARQDAEVRTEMGGLKRELLAVAARINPTLDVRFSRELFGEGPGLVASGLSETTRTAVAGMYEPYYHLATISLDRRFDPRDTAYHESFHSIERVLTPKERDVLRRAFPPGHGMSSEERVASSFANWALRRERLEAMGLGADTRDVRTAFRRMALFAGRSRTALLGHGFEKAEEIFERVYGGEMAARAVARLQRGAGAPARAAAKAYAVDSPALAGGDRAQPLRLDPALAPTDRRAVVAPLSNEELRARRRATSEALRGLAQHKGPWTAEKMQERLELVAGQMALLREAKARGLNAADRAGTASRPRRRQAELSR